MQEPSGLDLLFDVMFHEIENLHPIAKQRLNQRLLNQYHRYDQSQQKAIDQLFGDMTHLSFKHCFGQ